MGLNKLLILLSFVGLAACGGPAEPLWAPREDIQKYSYRHNGPPMLTLYTVVSTSSGSGAHSGLLVNGRERIIFDPAGTFNLPFTPERNDVLFGMTSRAVSAYIDYHARKSHNVIEQRLPVTAQQAEMIAKSVKEYGAVPKAQCALAITRILKDIPGFDTIPVGYFPKRAQAWFADQPNVQTRIITDEDADKTHNIVFEPR